MGERKISKGLGREKSFLKFILQIVMSICQWSLYQSKIYNLRNYPVKHITQLLHFHRKKQKEINKKSYLILAHLFFECKNRNSIIVSFHKNKIKQMSYEEGVWGYGGIFFSWGVGAWVKETN